MNPLTPSELRVQGLAGHVNKGNHKDALECILREKQIASRIALVAKLVHYVRMNRSHLKKENDEYKPLIDALLKVPDIDSACLLVALLSEALRRQADSEINVAREILEQNTIDAIRSGSGNTGYNEST